MSTEPQIPHNLSTIVISIILTISFIGVAAFVFSPNFKIQQETEPIDKQIIELKQNLEDNNALKEKIVELETQLNEINQTEEDIPSVKGLINTDSWKNYFNDSFKLAFKYPTEYILCLNDECNDDIRENEADYFKVWQTQNEMQETETAITIYPRINNLKKLAIEFGQDTFLKNKDLGNVIEKSEAIGIINGLLAYQFDVANEFIESGVSLKSNKLTIDKNGKNQIINLSEPHRVIYLDYNNLIYRIMYPVNDTTFETVLGTLILDGKIQEQRTQTNEPAKQIIE